MNRVLPRRARLCEFGGAVRERLRWPLPALAGWACAWGAYALLHGADPLTAAVAGCALGAALGLAWPASVARRLLIAGGFPLSLAASGLALGLPAALWLLPVALLALVYPLSAWRDAPVYPTPAGALDGLGDAAQLGPGAAVLDAGCGVGDGLRALARACPGARVDGVERSRLLGLIARARCRHASVAHGDMWRLDWRPYALVYLFQRPESMARAWAKAEHELAPGAWLASLEFPVPGREVDRVLHNVPGKPVWLYRIHARRHAQSDGSPADNSAELRADGGTRRHRA